MTAKAVRVEVVRFSQPWPLEAVYRVVEQSGAPCVSWLPGLELDDPEGPLDRGGFESKHDARCFALGVCWERAYHGMLTESTADIDAERERLNAWPTPEEPALPAPEQPVSTPLVEHAQRRAHS